MKKLTHITKEILLLNLFLSLPGYTQEVSTLCELAPQQELNIYQVPEKPSELTAEEYRDLVSLAFVRVLFGEWQFYLSLNQPERLGRELNLDREAREAFKENIQTTKKESLVGMAQAIGDLKVVSHNENGKKLYTVVMARENWGRSLDQDLKHIQVQQLTFETTQNSIFKKAPYFPSMKLIDETPFFPCVGESIATSYVSRLGGYDLRQTNPETCTDSVPYKRWLETSNRRREDGSTFYTNDKGRDEKRIWDPCS